MHVSAMFGAECRNKKREYYCTHSGIFYDAIGVKKVSNEEMSFVTVVGARLTIIS